MFNFFYVYRTFFTCTHYSPNQFIAIEFLSCSVFFYNNEGCFFFTFKCFKTKTTTIALSASTNSVSIFKRARVKHPGIRMITFWTFHYFTPFLYFLLSFYYEIYICLYHFIIFLQVFHNEGLEDFKIHHTIYFKIYSNSVYRNNFLKKWFYVNCWGEIKISLQFITLFGFHSGANFSLSAGG